MFCLPINKESCLSAAIHHFLITIGLTPFKTAQALNRKTSNTLALISSSSVFFMLLFTMLLKLRTLRRSAPYC